MGRKLCAIENVETYYHSTGFMELSGNGVSRNSGGRDVLSQSGLERERQLEPDLDDLERQAELARQERAPS